MNKSLLKCWPSFVEQTTNNCNKHTQHAILWQVTYFFGGGGGATAMPTLASTFPWWLVLPRQWTVTWRIKIQRRCGSNPLEPGNDDLYLTLWIFLMLELTKQIEVWEDDILSQLGDFSVPAVNFPTCIFHGADFWKMSRVSCKCVVIP